MVELLALLTCFAVAISAQESPNQNQSDTLINALIYLPLYTVSGSGNGVLNQTFCDAYAPKNATQYAFITKLVERAFIGDYTPNTNQSVYQAQGILNSSAYYRDPTGNVNSVNLLPYFNGALKSTNRAGVATSVAFFEGVNGTCFIDGYPVLAPTSDGYRMIAHIAQYLGVILGCDTKSFPKYVGNPSQAQVHRFMDLYGVEVHYFIHNIYDSALSSGITQPDGIVIGTALDNMFNKICSPQKVIAPYQPAEYQGICLNATTCAPWVLGNSNCAAYNRADGFGVEPQSSTLPISTRLAACGQQTNTGWLHPSRETGRHSSGSLHHDTHGPGGAWEWQV